MVTWSSLRHRTAYRISSGYLSSTRYCMEERGIHLPANSLQGAIISQNELISRWIDISLVRLQIDSNDLTVGNNPHWFIANCSSGTTLTHILSIGQMHLPKHILKLCKGQSLNSLLWNSLVDDSSNLLHAHTCVKFWSYAWTIHGIILQARHYRWYLSVRSALMVSMANPICNEQRSIL